MVVAKIMRIIFVPSTYFLFKYLHGQYKRVYAYTSVVYQSRRTFCSLAFNKFSYFSDLPFPSIRNLYIKYILILKRNVVGIPRYFQCIKYIYIICTTNNKCGNRPANRCTCPVFVCQLKCPNVLQKQTLNIGGKHITYKSHWIQTAAKKSFGEYYYSVIDRYHYVNNAHHVSSSSP